MYIMNFLSINQYFACLLRSYMIIQLELMRYVSIIYFIYNEYVRFGQY